MDCVARCLCRWCKGCRWWLPGFSGQASTAKPANVRSDSASARGMCRNSAGPASPGSCLYASTITLHRCDRCTVSSAGCQQVSSDSSRLPPSTGMARVPKPSPRALGCVVLVRLLVVCRHLCQELLHHLWRALGNHPALQWRLNRRASS